MSADDVVLRYLTGFGNEHATEAIDGVLPMGQNSPQQVARGLYAEQLSGTAFTTPRSHNLRSWLYRVRPSVRHVTGLRPIDAGLIRTAPCQEEPPSARPLRWDPTPIDADAATTFVSGLATVATNGNAHLGTGGAAHIFVATTSMVDEVFVDTDGELVIVPDTGRLRLATEFGLLDVGPTEIAVIPRGVAFAVQLLEGPARGYVAENYGVALTLPEPGLIGPNSLAQPRDFEYPTAHPHDDRPTRLVCKHDGHLFEAHLDHTPLDVVAWRGNHAPYRYDLRRYCPIGPVLFDHPDPSIWTMLTSPSDTPGTANIDFVVFRERWSVSEHTFRPPYYHRNVMSELMGLVDGVYDAKPHGFTPGGLSIHNAFIPHGPDLEAFEAASTADLQPERMPDALAFMLESRFVWRPTAWAMAASHRQPDYEATWAGLDARPDS